MAPYTEERSYDEHYTAYPDAYETSPSLARRPSDAQASNSMSSDPYSFASGSRILPSQPPLRRPLRHSVWSLKMDSQRRPSFHMARNNSYGSEHTLSPIGSDDDDESDRDVVDEDVGEGNPPTELPVFQEQKSKLELASQRRLFIRFFGKALLCVGAPSHRIEAQLNKAAETMKTKTSFVYLPSIIILSFHNVSSKTSDLHFVKAGGRLSLSALHRVQDVYEAVVKEKIGATAGVEQLARIMKRAPIYPVWLRCIFAFICGAVICLLSFGGSFLDMWVAGACACALQFLSLRFAPHKEAANIFEISIAMLISFLARGLATIPGHYFCYSAISSAGVVLILPGFAILISALELASRNMFCGAVRLVHAIIYTFFLNFALTLGSELFIVIVPSAQYSIATPAGPADIMHGYFDTLNGTSPLDFTGTWTFATASTNPSHVAKGCYHDPSWSWYRRGIPWWLVFLLVPLYSLCSSLLNLQAYRSWRLLAMISFSCAAYTANKLAGMYLFARADIASGAGAFVLGILGNVYAKFVKGAAFTSMITGVLFLVPSALSQTGALLQQTEGSSAQQYLSSFALGVRMVEVAIGVTVGLLVSQMITGSGMRKGF